MITLRELDDHVTYFDQLHADAAPIVLINTFHVALDDAEQLVTVWADDAAFMKRQPGYISALLHRGVGGSGTFVNVAAWESVATLRAAFTAPEFQATLARYPDTAVASPHIFQPVAVTRG
jgi:heme-degrading monooxygenase HmoA